MTTHKSQPGTTEGLEGRQVSTDPFSASRLLFKLKAVYPEEPTFVMLRTHFRWTDGGLASVVKSLLQRGLITKESVKSKGNRRRTSYRLSPEGFIFAESLLREARPQLQGIEIQP